MDLNKKTPIFLMIVADILIFAVALLTFAYFHHVKNWGEESGKVIKRYESDTPGDFSEAFSAFFTGEGVFTLSENAAIRDYAKENKLPLPGDAEDEYTLLYRSGQVYFTLRTVHFTAGGEEETGYVYDIFVKELKNLFTVATKADDMTVLMQKAENTSGGKVVAAINGDYHANKNHCRVSVRNSELLYDAGEYDSDLCVIYADGEMMTYSYKNFDFEAVEKEGPYQIFDFGPQLLDGKGKAITSFDDNAYDKNILSGRHPRTVIGYYEPGHYAFVMIDGEKAGMNDGVSMKDTAKYMEKLGCVSAYNLDGGDSSQAYAMGNPVRLGERKDKDGKQRVLSDIICIIEYPEEKKGEGEV